MSRGRQVFGELKMVGADIDGNLREGQTFSYPTYTCAHCSTMVVMRPNRERPRKSCMSCGGWICEKKQICNEHCTPLYELSQNGGEDTVGGEYAKYLPAVMAGVESIKEAEEKGLILP